MDATTPSNIEAASWLFENTLDVLLVIRDGRIEVASPSWRSLTGWSDTETLGRDCRDFIHPDETQSFLEQVAILRQGGTVCCDHRLLSRAGEWLWVRSRTKSASGGRSIAVMQDISAERRAAEEQARAARLAELLGDKAGISLWRYDPEAQIYDFTSNLDGDGGGDPSLVRAGAEMAAEVHPDDQLRVEAAIARTVATGASAAIEYRHNVRGQGWRRLRADWSGLRQKENGTWEVLGLSQDVTEISDARDAALEAAEVKSRFLANMSHEVRTPMNGVLGVLHLLKSDALSDRNRALVEEALACGTALAQLLQDIVEFTDLEAGKLELAPQPVELAGALEPVVAMLRPEAEGRGLYLEVEAPRSGNWGRTDPVRLRQILLNLVGNAVKFTLRGGVKVKLAAQGQGAAQRIRIEVRDTGIGVAAEAQASLFERFQQADASNTRRFGGMGLGLAVTRALVEAMEGRIGFLSVEGEGSTFWVDLPAPVCEAPAEPEATICLKGLTVLVVEDNPTNRLVATRMLGELGAEVDTAENGADGVALARTGRYDVIFMDIQMPVMDGVQATRAIRALPGPAALTPIVATTANVLSHQLDAYRKSGMDGCVAKPISPGALLGEIARLAGQGA